MNYEMTQPAADVVARAEMFRAGAGAEKITTEMLLIALSEEEDGAACPILQSLGVHSDMIRDVVDQLTRKE